MSKKESINTSDLLGPVTIHYEDGKKVGESRQTSDLLGSVTINYDESNRKTGESRQTSDLLGPVTVHYNDRDEKTSESRQTSDLLGSVTTYDDCQGNTTGESRRTSNLLGPVTVHSGDVPFMPSKKTTTGSAKGPSSPNGTTRTSTVSSFDSSSVSSGSASSQKKPRPRDVTVEYFKPRQASGFGSEKKSTPTPSSSGGFGGREIGNFVGDSIGSALGVLGIGFLFYCIFESISKPKLEKPAEEKNEEPEPQPFLNFRQVGGDKETLDLQRRLEEEMPDLRRSLEEGIARSKIYLAQLEQRYEQERLAKVKKEEEDFCNRPIEVLQAELKQARTLKQRLRLLNAIAKKPRPEKTSSLLPSAPKMFPRPRPTYMCPERKDRPRPYVPRTYKRKTPGKILELAVMTVGVVATILILAIKMGFISIGE